MLKNCCFCIDLRTATLILSICGTVRLFDLASPFPNTRTWVRFIVADSHSHLSAFRYIAQPLLWRLLHVHPPKC
ncbi:hypothetical protein BC938DRAFT_471417 [Jimgerdemannia flammicorona]|uniref:Uncharacterized protein n=1 Tax=Jimgerdemannia flammicorona TaxID=994334 RepID=A0A433Q859_9FUNG|nr:hypothetical protein BC938DRAFT_471417 [Jimgerdemannia flammicorona]